jgi:predicted dithiol-disulfide oxidoreductase (DUF899 family)
MNASATEIAGEIERIEEYLVVQHERLAELKRQLPGREVSDYTLARPQGPVRLSDLFATKSDLIVIHNMGKGCRYCTLWADGFNGVWRHLADRAGFVVVSPDPPAVQRAFADARGWTFPIASGHGSTFIEDMGFRGEKGWKPGATTFQRGTDGKILRVASTPFGPFDPFCPVWHLMALLGDGVNDWEPKYQYGS